MLYIKLYFLLIITFNVSYLKITSIWVVISAIWLYRVYLSLIQLIKTPKAIFSLDFYILSERWIIANSENLVMCHFEKKKKSGSFWQIPCAFVPPQPPPFMCSGWCLEILVLIHPLCTMLTHMWFLHRHHWHHKHRSPPLSSLSCSVNPQNACTQTGRQKM